MSMVADTKQNAINVSSSPSGKIEFELTVTRIDDFEQMSYTAYGIRAIGSNGETIACYPDISSKIEVVRALFELLSGSDISALHIGDVIEDFLC